MARNGDVRLELGNQVDDYLRSEALNQVLLRKAQAIAAACGDGYVARRSTTYRVRARAAVITYSMRARHSNRRHNTILRNLGAGRG